MNRLWFGLSRLSQSLMHLSVLENLLTSSPKTMELLPIGELIFVLLVLIPVLRIIHTSTRPSLPGPGLLEYLPRGLVYPLLREPLHFSRVLEKLGHIYGDVFSLWVGPTRVIVTSVPKDIVQIMTATQIFDRPPAIKVAFDTLAPGGIFCMPKVQHLAVRKKLRSGFNHKMLKSFHEHMQKALEELCDSLTAATEKGNNGLSQVVDISELLTVTTFRVMTNVAFGISLNREERFEFHDWVKHIGEQMTEDIVGYPVRQILTPFGVRNKFFELRDKIRRTCSSFIERRLEETAEEKGARAPDLLDAILDVEDHSIQELTSVATEFTLAGTYTMSQSIARSLYEICCNLRVRTEVEREMSEHLGSRPIHEPISFEDLEKLPYISKIWRETHRIYPVGPFITRKTTCEVTLEGSGIHLPKGTEVLANYRRCQMSPDIWKDPQSFKPERWGSGSEMREGNRVPAGAYVPFSLGPHNCPGRFLADYEAALILAELLRRFRFSLACTPEQIMTYTTFVDSPKYVNEKGEVMGVPVRVQLKA